MINWQEEADFLKRLSARFGSTSTIERLIAEYERAAAQQRAS